MRTAKNTLHIKVSETLAQTGARAANAMRAAQSGTKIAPYFGVSFADIGHCVFYIAGVVSQANYKSA